MKSFKLVAASIGAATAMFAAGASAQSPGVLLPISITNASGNVADMTKAADGNPNTIWNSGAGPTQWIDIDLGSERMFSTLRMLPSQNPAGSTTHHIWGRNDAGQWFNFGGFSGYTQDNNWIEFNNLQEIPVRTIILETTSSPSWVAWREFQVLDGGELRESCYSNDYNQGWVLYSATRPGNKCGHTQGQFLYKFRNVSQQRTGTRVNACALAYTEGWSIVPGSTANANGRCSGFQFDRLYLLQRD